MSFDFDFGNYDVNDWDPPSPPRESYFESQRRMELERKSGKFFFDKVKKKIDLASTTLYLGENGADYYGISCGPYNIVSFLQKDEYKKKTTAAAEQLHLMIFQLLFENHYTEHYVAECMKARDPDPEDFVRPNLDNSKLGELPSWVDQTYQPDLAMYKAKHLGFQLFKLLFDEPRVLTLDMEVKFEQPLGAQTFKSDFKELLGYMVSKLGEGRMYSLKSREWIEYKKNINQISTKESCKHFMVGAAWYIDEFFEKSNFNKVLGQLKKEAKRLPVGYTINEEAILVYTRIYVYSVLCTALHEFFGKGGLAALEEGIVTLFANCTFLHKFRKYDDLIYGDEFLNCLASVLMYCQFMPQHLQQEEEKMDFPLKLQKRDGTEGYYIKSAQFYLARLAECAKALDFLPYREGLIMGSQAETFKFCLLKNAYLIKGKKERTQQDVATYVMSIFGLQYENESRGCSNKIYFSTRPYWVRKDVPQHSFGTKLLYLDPKYENVANFTLDESAPAAKEYCEKVFQALKECRDYDEHFDHDVIKTYDSVHMGYLYHSIYLSLWITTGTRDFVRDLPVDSAFGVETLDWVEHMHDRMSPAHKKLAKSVFPDKNAFLFEKVYFAAMRFRKEAYDYLKTRRVTGQYHYSFGDFPSLYDDNFSETHNAEAAPRQTGSNCFVNYYSVRRNAFKVTDDNKLVVETTKPGCSIM